MKNALSPFAFCSLSYLSCFRQLAVCTDLVPSLSQHIKSTKDQLRKLVELKSELDEKYGEEIVEPKKDEKMGQGSISTKR